MPQDIAQLRPEGIDAAVAFAETVGFKLADQTLDPQVSLIVKDADDIIAAVLGVRTEGGACELHVCLGKVEDPGKLTGELLNKALMKVHGAGARRCQIHHHGREDLPTDWPAAQWTGQNEPEAA